MGRPVRTRAEVSHHGDGCGAERSVRSGGETTLRAIRKTWPADPADWWLPPQVEPLPKPAHLASEACDVASYTNYRYWPELLSSGLLPAEMANRIVAARLSAGGSSAA